MAVETQTECRPAPSGAGWGLPGQGEEQRREHRPPRPSFHGRGTDLYAPERGRAAAGHVC